VTFGDWQIWLTGTSYITFGVLHTHLPRIHSVIIICNPYS
jgi:hypothetical protein